MANNPADDMSTNRVPVDVPGGFFIYDVFGDEGICYADVNVLALFGCRDIDELRALTGNSFVGMVHPDDRERVTETIKEVNRERRKDGTVIQVICNGERYFDSSVRAFRSSIMVFEVT